MTTFQIFFEENWRLFQQKYFNNLCRQVVTTVTLIRLTLKGKKGKDAAAAAAAVVVAVAAAAAAVAAAVRQHNKK